MGNLVDFLEKNDTNFRKTRLPALYAEFRSLKNLNPDGYEANVFAWSQAIARLASEGLLPNKGSSPSLFVFEADESLRSSLNHDRYGMPQSLGLAIRECVAQHALIPLSTFERTKRSVYSVPTWGNLPWNIITWTAHQLGASDLRFSGDRIVGNQYVIMKNLEAASTEVGKRIDARSSLYDRAMTKEQFRREFATSLISDQPLSLEDLDVLLQYLSRDKRLIAHVGNTVRILAEGEHWEIMPEDIFIGENKQLVEDLHHQIELLNRRIEDLDQEARAAVLGKNRIKALGCLKSKKLAESTLVRRYTSLIQLEEIALKVQQASSDVDVVKILEQSADALESLNSQLGGSSRVHSVMSRLQSQMEATDEVAAILAESTDMVVDEVELDGELEAMEKEQKEKEEEEKGERELVEVRKQLDSLLSVPTDPISERAKTQSPTAETGIARLALGD